MKPKQESAVCARCGKAFARNALGPRRKYCDACRAQKAREYEREHRAQLREQGKERTRKKKAAAAAAKANDLAAFVRRMEAENRERTRRGLKPLSYGRYVQMLREEGRE